MNYAISLVVLILSMNIFLERVFGEEEIPRPHVRCVVKSTHNGPVVLYSPKPNVGDTFELKLAELEAKTGPIIVYNSSREMNGDQPILAVTYPFKIVKVLRHTDGSVGYVRMISHSPRISADKVVYSYNLDLGYAYAHDGNLAGISGSVFSVASIIKGITFFECKVLN